MWVKSYLSLRFSRNYYAKGHYHVAKCNWWWWSRPPQEDFSLTMSRGSPRIELKVEICCRPAASSTRFTCEALRQATFTDLLSSLICFHLHHFPLLPPNFGHLVNFYGSTWLEKLDLFATHDNWFLNKGQGNYLPVKRH